MPSIFAFDEQSMRRIEAAVLAVEGRPLDKPLLRRRNITGGANRPMVVKVYDHAGEHGTAAANCAITYTIKDMAGKTLETTLTPERPRYPLTTYIGAPDASYGLAIYTGSAWVLLVAFEEIEDTSVCA